jgi:hypothetical protein
MKEKLVDLAEMRMSAAMFEDKQLMEMNDRELRATVLENYCGENATETVIRTRAAEAQGRTRGR